MHELCISLNVPHPDYLTDVLSYRQVADWLIYKTEKGLNNRDDLFWSHWLCMFVNSNRKAGSPATVPSDFAFYEESETLTEQDMLDNLRIISRG